VYILITANT